MLTRRLRRFGLVNKMFNKNAHNGTESSANDTTVSESFVIAEQVVRADRTKLFLIWAICASLSTVGVIWYHLANPVIVRIPYQLLVDRVNATVQYLPPTLDKSITSNEAILKAQAARFIKVSESFYATTADRDAKEVYALSDETVAAWWRNRAITEKWAESYAYWSYREAQIISVVPQSPTVFTVRYAVYRKSFIGSESTLEGSYVATIPFSFSFDNRATEAQLLQNPIGFKVIAGYRIDSEVAM